MKKLLAFLAVAEAATGLALMIIPSLARRLLLGAELSGVAIPLARVAGIALIALGVACWPGVTALCGMLTYSALVTLYLGTVAIRGEFAGPLLWPADELPMHRLRTRQIFRRAYTHRLARPDAFDQAGACSDSESWARECETDRLVVAAVWRIC